MVRGERAYLSQSGITSLDGLEEGGIWFVAAGDVLGGLDESFAEGDDGSGSLFGNIFGMRI